MVYFGYVVAILCVSQFVQAQQPSASSITACPTLSPRIGGPKDAHDIRADDIKAVGSLGDSFMTGFAAEGMRGSLLNITTYYEYRDVSFVNGGRPNSMSLSNAFKHYSGASVRGSSTGQRPPTFCRDLNCSSDLHKPDIDQLNAALDVAWSTNLNQELDYLIPQMKKLTGLRYTKDWKMIIIQIGNNDMCYSCNSRYNQQFGADKYYTRLDQAIDRIRREIPRTIVNIVGSVKLSSVFKRTRGQEYCERLKVPVVGLDLIFNRLACECAVDDGYWPQFDKIGQQYDQQIEAVYEKYKGLSNDSFGLMYTPTHFDPIDWPLEMFSNFDCLHPSVKGHQWIATTLWNLLFKNQTQRAEHIDSTFGNKVYCPTESDRLQLS
ncbi:hypothetical protein BJV82DRAFT_650928 [Fennellomyces sp. T-0311]|nr:hypothetical protein BJV82DRAFT_650928 [Fennellomyces sp. T-0311]